MYRIASALLFAFCVISAPVFAKTFSIPSENPVATVNIPNSWEPNEYDGGVEGTSKDGDFYFAFEAVTKSNVAEATRESMIWFVKQGVMLDPNSQTTNESTLNGSPVYVVSYTGKDKDGPTKVTMVIVSTNKKDRFLVIYGWGSEKADQANRKEIDKIIGSISLTK